MERSQQENNAINRVLKSWGLEPLDVPGTVARMAYMVDGHEHLQTLLRACDPELRREMYEAMTPHLRFKARPLESYIIASKEHAEAAQLPIKDQNGNLHPYVPPNITVVEVPEFELWLQCHKCQKEAFFFGERKVDAIAAARTSGNWAVDELGTDHVCPECLDAMG